jgi:cbb3-type cytochrome oxidase subunit 3
MKSELLAKSPLLALPIGALLFFLVVFLGVLVVTLRKKGYEAVAELPLSDDEGEARK